MDGWINGWVNGWMNGWVDRWMDEWMESGWMYKKMRMGLNRCLKEYNLIPTIDSNGLP